MENTNDHQITPQNLNLSDDNLDKFFLTHLNRIYCAKAHLMKKLPELANLAAFTDLRFAIEETIEIVGNQLVRMNEIYTILNSNYSEDHCTGLVGLVEDAFEAIKQNGHNLELRDMSTLYYMLNIESVETASFQILQIAADKLGNKQIKQLLKESFDEAKDDRALFLEISAKYIAS